jgi:hypothetical protein
MSPVVSGADVSIGTSGPGPVSVDGSEVPPPHATIKESNKVNVRNDLPMIHIVQIYLFLSPTPGKSIWYFFEQLKQLPEAVRGLKEIAPLC